MNARLPATYFTGETLRSWPVTVQVTDGGQLHIAGEGIDRVIPAGDASVSDRLGQVPYFLHLPDDGVVELPCDEPAREMLAALQPDRGLPALIHRLESHSAIAAAATLLLAITVAAVLWQGLPRLARRAAYLVPVSIETEAGKAGYAYFARAYRRSVLTRDERRPVYHALDRLKKTRAMHVEPTVMFFHLGTPNAFALPGGTIVVADELVRLAQSEEEIAAVLAHELGHVEKRHGLQSVLRNSSALIVVSTVTGDLSTLSNFSGTLPFLLLEYGYSREFEHEADEYGIGLLRDAHIDPVYLAVMLQRLEKSRPVTGPDFSYLSTHPATEERIRFVESFRFPVSDPASRAAMLVASPVLKFEAKLDNGEPHLADGISKNPHRYGSDFDQVPRVISRTLPIYPDAMRQAGIEGEVTVDFLVGVDGHVYNVHAVHSSHPEFEAPAVEAVRQWEFRPAMKNGRLADAHMQVPVGFTLTDAAATLTLAAGTTSTSTIPGEKDHPATFSAPDSMPYPISHRSPSYPESMRQAGISGDVGVEFDVDANGSVMNARVVSSSHPDFDEAALAAVRRWKFQPAVKNSRPVNAHLRDTLKFRLTNPDPSR